ncbi:cobalamin-binding protein [Solitalea longa]|uniref:Cobalamin-binding protein n=1 Tax=Solitalea longa TaxID=2079460 RepID=A0A2S5A646_9SPHI|nr:helical backbone metal receptor [Solitalea longa]POY37986.1 cobalamin-binding protein [Solitalea longa]
MAKKQFTDQMGRTIEVNFPPQRIVSLVPSQTELLFELDLGNKVVGITKFCIHPEEWFKNTPKVGGTKKLNIEEIRALKPDLIIGNKEENQREQIEMLMKEFPVWMSDISTFDEACEMIVQVGALVDKEKESKTLAENIRGSFDELFQSEEIKRIKERSPTIAYFIWKDPYMVAASNTFIDHMINLLGMKNCFQFLDRYAEIKLEDLKSAAPQFVFLSSEPYPFKDKHVTEIGLEMPNTHVLIVDGEMFSWYGSRLLHASKYFKKIFS